MTFELDLLGVGVSFVVPLLWFVGQIVALIVLRGAPRWLASVPVVLMAMVIPMTYRAWRAHSNLWPLSFIFASFPAAIVVAVALGMGKPKLSRALKIATGVGTIGLVAVAFIHSADRSHARRVGEQRQNEEADAIIRMLDAVVPVGEVRTSDPAALAPDAVRDVVVRSGILYNTCYRQGLALDPHLGGSLEVELDVGADGRVARARMQQSTGATSVERCIMEALQKLEFSRTGPAAPGTFTAVTIAMQLRPPGTTTRSR